MSHHHEEKSYTNSFNISKSETFKSVVITGPTGFDVRTSAPLITQEVWNSTPPPPAAPAVVPQPEVSKGNESVQTFRDSVYVKRETGISTSASMSIITLLLIIALLIILGLSAVVILVISGVLIPETKPTLVPYSETHGTEPSTTTPTLPPSNATTVPSEISTPQPNKPNPNTTVNITCLHDLHSIGSKTTAVTITSLYSKPEDWDWNGAPNLGNRGPKIHLKILSQSLDQVENLNKILDWLRNRVENVTLDGRNLMACPNSQKEPLSPIILPEVGKIEIFNITRCLINNVLKYWQIPKVLDIFVYCTDQKESYGADLLRLFNPKVRKLNNFTVTQQHCHEIKM